MQDPLLTILKTSFNQSDRTGLHAQRIISENNLKSGDQATNSSVVSSWCISHFSIGKDTSQLLANDYFHGWFKGKHHIQQRHLRNAVTNGASLPVPRCCCARSLGVLRISFSWNSIPSKKSQKHISNGLKTFIYLKPFVWNQQNKTLVYGTSYCSGSVIYLCFRP